MKLYKKLILEGILLASLWGLSSCNNNSTIRDVEYINKQDTTLKVSSINGAPVEYDSLGRIVLMNGNLINYNKSGKVSSIGGHKVFYDEKGRIVRNPIYYIENKKKLMEQ